MGISGKNIGICLVGFAVITGGIYLFTRPTDLATALQKGKYLQAAKRMESQNLNGEYADNPVVLTTLANLYYVGLGVSRNPLRSAQLYSEAAFAGNVAAQVNMGHVYANGVGVQADGIMAYAWFNLARTNGSKIAQHYMSGLLADRKMPHQSVNEVRTNYATLANFTKLH